MSASSSAVTHLFHTTTGLFAQLKDVLHAISSAQYMAPVSSLDNATVGQHVRHVIEFYSCLVHAKTSGKVNYEARPRDLAIETDPLRAIDELQRIQAQLAQLPANQSLVLHLAYAKEETSEVPSCLYREWVHNIEHATHHMALIRIGVREQCPNITLPADFGVAADTMRYRASRKPVKEINK